MKMESKSINVPEELLDNANKVIEALKNSRSLHQTRGLNITQLSKETGLNKYTLNKVLGSLETTGIVEGEKQGSSRVYYYKESD
jgi:DNA-binding IclR family transcriptional regulator